MNVPIEYPDLSQVNATLKLRGFRVRQNRIPKSPKTAFGRRHYFLIVLSIGESKVYYNDRTFHLDGTYLLMLSPKVPYATEIISENQTGYSCVFTGEFIQPVARLESLMNSPLLKTSDIPAFKLDATQQARITNIFETMISHDDSSYLYKDDLMRNYILAMVHEALQMRTTEHFTTYNTASDRITSLFLDILERQFPIEHLCDTIALCSPQDFANKLNIHVNSLNRAVKEVINKPSSTVINERIMSEAKSLLQHTRWSIAEIAYALGYEYPNYFSNSFKKATGYTPITFRNAHV